MSIVLVALLVVANVLGVGMIVPQVVRLRRQRTVDGVSAPWIGIGLALNLWWLAYALASGLWGLVPVSVGGAIVYGLVAQAYGRLVGGRTAIDGIAGGLVPVAAVPLPFLVVGGWTAAGLAIGSAYGLQFGPAAVSAVRAASVAGISPTTWIMAWGEAVIWLLYGLSTADAALMVGGGGAAVAATVIVARLAVGGENDRRLPHAIGNHGPLLASGDGSGR